VPQRKKILRAPVVVLTFAPFCRWKNQGIVRTVQLPELRVQI
jgi:hypothetical protein